MFFHASEMHIINLIKTETSFPMETLKSGISMSVIPPASSAMQQIVGQSNYLPVNT
jgi:hypothetical protein